MTQTYKAIDLFAGIGGIRLGFEQAFKGDIEFIFSDDNDPYCRETYEVNFNNSHFISDDILKIDINKIPEFDILLAGFPCQAFSIAGKKKGFDDKRGILFFKIVEILEKKQPSTFFLENVKHLKNHDKKKTFLEIIRILEEDLNYKIHFKVLNAVDFGLPQNRKRLFIIGFKHDVSFKFPSGNVKKNSIKTILEKDTVEIKYYLSQQYLNTLKKHKERHRSKGNGFGYEVISQEGIANTLVCGGMGKERNLVKDIIIYDPWKEGDDTFKKKNDEGIRKMTEREWARLQGFPESFKFPVSMTQAYKQIANSVPVPVVREIAIELKNSLKFILNNKQSS